MLYTTRVSLKLDSGQTDVFRVFGEFPVRPGWTRNCRSPDSDNVACKGFYDGRSRPEFAVPAWLVTDDYVAT
jgi:hypothetical protein